MSSKGDALAVLPFETAAVATVRDNNLADDAKLSGWPIG
jgi:hypothetical protein